MPVEFPGVIKSGRAGLKLVFFYTDGGPSEAFLTEVADHLPERSLKHIRAIHAHQDTAHTRTEIPGGTNTPTLVCYRNGEQFKRIQGMPFIDKVFDPKQIAKDLTKFIDEERGKDAD